ncbi:hypothetical protein D3C77_269460 [compost metagenome]
MLMPTIQNTPINISSAHIVVSQLVSTGQVTAATCFKLLQQITISRIQYITSICRNCDCLPVINQAVEYARSLAHFCGENEPQLAHSILTITRYNGNAIAMMSSANIRRITDRLQMIFNSIVQQRNITLCKPPQSSLALG